MKFLLVTIGSHGDVHPFVGIGRELLRRGHRAVLVTNAHFEPLARQAGLDFAALGTDEDYHRQVANPDLWSMRRGFEAVFGYVIESLEMVHQKIVENLDDDAMLVISSLCVAGRVAQDELGIPTAMVHLSPSVFRSLIDPPKLPGMFMPRWMPDWLKRRMWETADRFVVDPLIAPPLNAFRAKRGLPPVKQVLNKWWHSPELTIGLFPEWWATPQRDWPPQVRLTGFPLFDERGHEPLPEALLRFLDAGDKPIAFTPGSAMIFGERFFKAAAGACARLGRRGILLSRHIEHIPVNLPAGVIHVPYAPFSELLPRCAALMHHGGIGTTSQALCAGVPQLIMPMAHDQPDNGQRVKRLGVGETISPRWLGCRSVASRIRKLIDDPATAAACAQVAGRFQNVDALGQTCALLESLGGVTRHATAQPASEPVSID